MREKFVLIVIGLLGISGIATSAHAQGIIQQCNGCTERQYESLATSLGIGNHLIGDFTNNVFNGYHVTRESNGGGRYIYEVDPLDVTSQQQSAFSDYRKLIVDYHASSIVVIVPTPRPSGYPTGVDGISAVDWAGITNYRNAMSVWVTNLQTQSVSTSWLPGSASVALLAMQSGVVVNGYDTDVTFQIQTTSGAIITLKWSSDAKTTLVSVVDQHGNNIPIRNFDGPTNFNGIYSFPGSDSGYSESLLNYLNQLGAHLSVNPSQFPDWYICVGAKCDQPN